MLAITVFSLLVSTGFAVSDESTELKCKFNISDSTVQPCKLLAQCTSETNSSAKSICDSTVMLAEKDVDGSFIVKGFGVAIGPQHILTSIEAKLNNEYENLYVITEGTNVHEVKEKQSSALFGLSKYNTKQWADFVLIEVADSTPLKFVAPMEVAAYEPELPFNPVTFVGDDSTIKITADGELKFHSDRYCKQVFYNDLFEFNGQYVTCGTDRTSKFSNVLSGAPVAIKENGKDNYVLIGLRTLTALHPLHNKNFLITKIGPNCDWLNSVSRGAIVCVDRDE